MSSPAESSNIRSYLRLCRIGNLPTVWTNSVAGAVLSGAHPSAFRCATLVLAVSAMYCGGMAMNDCVDARVDAQKRPDRPLPSGQLTLPQAATVSILLFLCSLSAFQLGGGPATLGGAILLLALVVLYNLSHNLSPLAVLPMAGCRFMIYPVAALACAGTVTAPLLAVALVQFAYVLLLTILARLEKQGRLNGKKRPLIPVMLAGIPVIDGIGLGVYAGGMGWLVLGIAGGALTLGLQSRVRGD